ncbi:hypothetical protein [Streptomyces afghaniensis]|uniref:hypothetical protein n=1 Tax=Streptomyces afghaniensis TaxID=66865 RepID=UPI0037999DA5
MSAPGLELSAGAGLEAGAERLRKSPGGLTRHRYVNAAKFNNRYVSEPHETDLGGEEAHQLLATAHANTVCPPSGYSTSWDDCYASADQLPLHHKADLL